MRVMRKRAIPDQGMDSYPGVPSQHVQRSESLREGDARTQPCGQGCVWPKDSVVEFGR